MMLPITSDGKSKRLGAQLHNGSTRFSLSPFDVVIWTCVAVFVIAAIAACLNIFGGLPTIVPAYQDKVFYALIVEIVGIGVATFAKYMRVPAAGSDQHGRVERAPAELNFAKPRSAARFWIFIVALILLIPSGYLFWLVAFVPAEKLRLSGDYYWVEGGSRDADWAGRDYATTIASAPPIPKYTLNGVSLCGAAKVGYVAVCWDNRPNGYPANVVTDIPAGTSPRSWCTYKDSSVSLDTPRDGRAPLGHVFMCGRALPH
jgi:hypothetical protein